MLDAAILKLQMDFQDLSDTEVREFFSSGDDYVLVLRPGREP